MKFRMSSVGPKNKTIKVRPIYKKDNFLPDRELLFYLYIVVRVRVVFSRSNYVDCNLQPGSSA